MPDTWGSTGCSTPVGYRSRGDTRRLPSPAGPMSWRCSHSTSFFLASTYITSGFARQAAYRGGVADSAARARGRQRPSRRAYGKARIRRSRTPSSGSTERQRGTKLSLSIVTRGIRPRFVRLIRQPTRECRRYPQSCLTVASRCDRADDARNDPLPARMNSINKIVARGRNEKPIPSPETQANPGTRETEVRHDEVVQNRVVATRCRRRLRSYPSTISARGRRVRG